MVSQPGNGEDRLPPELRARLDAFPVGEVRDQADRLAASAVEMGRVQELLQALGVAIDKRHEMSDVYLWALYRRMDAAGRNWSEMRETNEGRMVGVLHKKRGRLRRAADRLMRSSGIWLSNRRTSGRRARWERLLT